MNILLFDACYFTMEDIASTFDHMGIHYKYVLYKLINLTEDSFFEHRIRKYLKKEPFDAVFSVNYFPILSRICEDCRVPYLAWSYDSPLNIPNMEETLGNTVNHVFFFDRIEYEKYTKKGFRTVHHLPLGVNSPRLSDLTISVDERKKYASDVTLVGQLYESTLPGLMAPLGDFEKGYINAVLNAQLLLYGCYLLDDVITEDFMKKVNHAYSAIGQTAIKLEKYGLVTTMAKQVTRTERLILLENLSASHEVNLYSEQWDDSLSKVHYHGTVSYYTDMPKVFAGSKINLNPSLRCIQSGIPLRALDIMGAGGFLLSNYQPELEEYFTDGEEVVLYYSLEDALEKADFYLQHEDLRASIAGKGCEKVLRDFSYENRIKHILKTAGLQ